MTQIANDLRPPVDWTKKPVLRTAPFHHFCSVIERGDIEETLHSSRITVYDSGIKLDGKRNQARLCEVLEAGPGRWVAGGRQPAEVSRGQIVYVKERTVPFRLHLRRQNHFFVAMDAVMAELDRENLKLRPVGQFVVTREWGDSLALPGTSVEERVRRAIMGESNLHFGKTFGVEKKGSEADDVGCLKTRYEEVVAVGPGKFGGFVQRIEANSDAFWSNGAPPPCPWRIVTEPYWETPDCKVGDLIVFSDLARPTEITLAGRKYTLFEFDHSICAVLDQAV
jgi:co-chaperonin GroES (HSP10)